jgi:CO/xanthine dehydrogenase Mo-binding subunit
MNKAKLNYVGCSTPKVDAVDKVLGRAVYAEDIRFPDMLYGRVRWADIPHGIIEEIDLNFDCR